LSFCKMKQLFWITLALLLLLFGVVVVRTQAVTTSVVDGDDESPEAEKVVYDPEDDPEPASKEPSPKEVAEQREKNLSEWRLLMQEIMTSVSAGPMGEKFVPDYLARRKANIAMSKQLARARGQMISAMIETVGVRAETCFDHRFSDDVLSMLKSELEGHQFKVMWEPDPERNPTDTRWCYAGRETMVVRVPPAKPELPGQKE